MGVNPGGKKGQKEAKRERAVKALDLRIAGATYRQIGKQLQVSERTAYYDVQDELSRLDVIKAVKAEALRELELGRLERAQMGLWAGIQAGNPKSVMALVRIMERRARLLGLDAPLKTDQTVNVKGRLALEAKRKVLDRLPEDVIRDILAQESVVNTSETKH